MSTPFLALRFRHTASAGGDRAFLALVEHGRDDAVEGAALQLLEAKFAIHEDADLALDDLASRFGLRLRWIVDWVRGKGSEAGDRAAR